VRVVYDGEEGNHSLDAARTADGVDFDAVAVLEAAGVSLVDGGRSNGLMHNKMIIVDGQTLVMGSWNISYNDTFRNNNNILVITAPVLVANYQAKFEDLFAGNFGTHSTTGALTPVTDIDGVSVANYFSPDDEVMSKLAALMGVAQHSIRFYAFTYTHADLANAMIERFNAGVDVQGIIENRGASQGALVPLACAKVPVKVDGNKYTMHHKVIVIDDHIVITGSFNFTKSADNINDDNVLIIDDAVTAQFFLEEFDRLDAIAKDPDPADVVCP
jgi:phosphatidylserine/phosphatidylglycerophosphate/cardiolipin synthase-like enzyme